MDTKIARLKEEIYLVSLDVKDKYYQKALTKIQDLITTFPERAEPYYELGRFCYDNWLSEDAEANYQKALKIDPEYFPTYREYCFLLIKSGRYDDAINIIEKAFTLKTKEISDIYFYLGLAYQHKDEIEEAIDNYKLSLRHSANEKQISSARAFLETCLDLKEKYLYR